jgi:putative transposase
MNTVIRFDRNSLDDQQRDVATWPLINTDDLTSKEQKRVERFQRAIARYLTGGKVKDLCKLNGICKSELLRTIKRCLEVHEDGRVWGFRALVSHAHLKGYQRTETVKPATGGQGRGGRVGALRQLFDRHPQLAELCETQFLKKLSTDIVHESRVPIKAIHKRFITACRALGLTAGDYPLNQKYLGRAAVYRYLKRFLNSPAGVKARCGEDAARTLRTGLGEISEPRDLRLLQQVEFDGHRIDLFCTILIPSPHGGFERVVIERFWILAIIEAVTRTILGYHISLRREYNQDDVLRCVKNALTPWEPKPLTIDGLKYPEGGCFHSDTYPDLQWAVWEEFKWDNAKAHLAKKTLNRLCTTVGCTPKPGPVADPNRRPFIERWFHTFEENGFSRLPSTTGGNPKDPKRKDPEKAALKFEISLEHIEELTAVVVANYNADPHSGIGNRPPLEHLGILLQDEQAKQMIRRLPEMKRKNLQLLNMEVSRVVRGNMRRGRRPYVEFEGVRYTSPVLSRSPELIRKRLRLIVNLDDARTALAFLPNGAELGFITAHGIWGRKAHTLEVRKAIFALRRRKLIHYIEGVDPIQVYLDFLATKARKSKSAAREHAKTKRALDAINNTSGKSSSSPPPARDPEPAYAPGPVPSVTILHKGMVF